MARICILTSAQQEMLPFYHVFKSNSSHTLSGIHYKTAQFAGHELMLCVCGVGMVNAAMAAGILINACAPDYLLFCGVAGATSPELDIGDVVIATEVISPEYMTTKAEFDGTPFAHCLIHPTQEAFMPEWLASAELPNLSLDYDFQVIEGRIASSDQFPAPKAEYPILVQNGLKAIDMETAAMYQVGWVSGTPCLAVRAISNCLQTDGTDPDMHQANVDKAPLHAAQVSLDLIRQF